MENTYNTIDHRLREEDLNILLEEKRLGYDTPRNTNQIRVVVVKINSELYDSDNRIETKESIRKMLAETDLEDNIERLHEQINTKLNPKP